MIYGDNWPFDVFTNLSEQSDPSLYLFSWQFRICVMNRFSVISGSAEIVLLVI
jgi:hypothetical protein